MFITALHLAIAILEVVGAVVIVSAAGFSVYCLLRNALQYRSFNNIETVRLLFAQRLVLALEFLIAADILATLHTPTQQGLIALGTIIIVRTVLSFSIAYELRHSAASRSGPTTSIAPTADKPE